MKENQSLYFYLLSYLLFYTPAASAQTIKFTDISSQAGVQGLLLNGHYLYGHGVAFADITGDQRPDLYLSNAMEIATPLPEMLYISQSALPFTEESEARSLVDCYGIGSHGIVFFDMDNDGDFDLFNGNTGDVAMGFPVIHNRLYQNDGSGVFTDISAAAGVQTVASFARSVLAFDANNDGFIDLYSAGMDPSSYSTVPNHFYLNQGNGTFSMVDLGATNVNADGFGPNGLTVADYDNDGDSDIYISIVDRVQTRNTRPANQFFIKQANGTYVNRAQSLGVLGLGWSDGAVFADYDNDGDLDLFVATSDNKTEKRLCVYRNKGDGTFQDLTATKNIYMRGFTPIIFDADNDGDLDIYVTSTYSKPSWIKLLLNDGAGNFSPAVNTGLEVTLYDTRGAGVADFDNDGDLDVYVTDTNKIEDGQYFNHLFRNDLSGTTHRWLKVSGYGPKGDWGALGSKIWVFDHNYMEVMTHLVGYKEIFSTFGFCSQNDPVQHFGLAQRDLVDVKIKLTDGSVFKFFGVEGGSRLEFIKPSLISLESGNDQHGTVNQPLPQPLIVKAVDKDNNPVMGVPITFAVFSGGGSLDSVGPLYSDKNGLAQTRYTLGPEVGEQIVRVSTPMLTDLYVNFWFQARATGLCGNVNDDGLTNSTDALIILSCDTGLDVSSFCPMNCGDVNGDGFANSTDALIILSYDVGMAVPFPVGLTGCSTNVTACAGCNP